MQKEELLVKLKQSKDNGWDGVEDLIVEYLAEYNDPAYNLSKFSEEIFEVGDVASKLSNKADGYKPPIEDFEEEFGDFLFRGRVYARQLLKSEEATEAFFDKVIQRIKFKAEKFAANVLLGKYGDRI